ncbi:MAG: mevalonate kinase [Candidatus Levybacteria bacterium RIFCSPLOWO2_01_FULL_37_26]|nr:MAG: mevalonate kinase [Candidatus Levybacteria bacterium RIFCSPHIGHO2_12_FULL_37_9]OGH39984.1 MAG: mevalonate kinase [Candidatus Levybacteria bacterium RIFCSPLOWO2_01_FULL_37_26]
MVSAPGKLMLLGEHAVVYNHPCIVTAVDQRMYVNVEVLDEPVFEFYAPDVQVVSYKKPLSEIGKGDIPKGARFVEIAVKEILHFVQNDNIGLKVTTKSEFSSQFGFGSSSASTVCTIKAVSEILGLNLTNKEIFDLSYKTVLDIQGKGSGFDIAAAVYGGTIYFVTGGKIIEPLDVKKLPLVVGYSGIKADTVTLVNQVKKSFANRQDKLTEIYNNIGVLVYKAKDALINMDWQKLGKLMNKNQDLLRELGVSIKKLDNMIKLAIQAGAYGAKLSGAGGGDCMIALHSVQGKLSVQEAIKKAGGDVINVKTNAEGVRIEK